MGTCFLHGSGGGGIILPFRVVGGTTQPSNPTDGTIWVKTSLPFTHFEFGLTWSTANVGTVVVTGTLGGPNPTGSQKVVWAFSNKVGGIPYCEKITLTGCKQVQGSTGNWVDLDAYVYYNGSWTQFSATTKWIIKDGTCLIDPVSNYNATLAQSGTNYKISAPSGGKSVAVNFECNNMAGRTVNITVTSAQVYPNQSTYYSGVLVNTAQATSGSKPAYVALTKMPTSSTSTTYTLKIPDSFTSGYLTIFFETYSGYATYYNIKDMWIA